MRRSLPVDPDAKTCNLPPGPVVPMPTLPVLVILIRSTKPVPLKCVERLKYPLVFESVAFSFRPAITPKFLKVV